MTIKAIGFQNIHLYFRDILIKQDSICSEMNYIVCHTIYNFNSHLSQFLYSYYIDGGVSIFTIVFPIYSMTFRMNLKTNILHT